MVLSAERKIALEDHYEVWGLEEVRKELRRPDRGEFTDPEVTEFARAWVEAKEARARRKKTYSVVFLAIAGVLVLGLAVVLVTGF